MEEFASIFMACSVYFYRRKYYSDVDGRKRKADGGPTIKPSAHYFAALGLSCPFFSPERTREIRTEEEEKACEAASELDKRAR